ncbi:hypothetical protein VTO42DRAFT_2384 [Malbranchea cinnamomea]
MMTSVSKDKQQVNHSERSLKLLEKPPLIHGRTTPSPTCLPGAGQHTHTHKTATILMGSAIQVVRVSVPVV